MKRISKKLKLSIVVIVIILLCSVSGIVLFNKPTGEYNQHPMPWLIGTLKFPEYLEGGCTDYSKATSKSTSYALITPPYVSRSIALKSIISDSEFWIKSKDILNNNLSWVVESYSVNKDENSDAYLLALSIGDNDWNSLSFENKYSILQKMSELIKANSIDSTSKLVIYSCDASSHSTWRGYANIDKDKNILIRFDWRRSLFEEFIDNINPFGDPDPT